MDRGGVLRGRPPCGGRGPRFVLGAAGPLPGAWRRLSLPQNNLGEGRGLASLVAKSGAGGELRRAKHLSRKSLSQPARISVFHVSAAANRAEAGVNQPTWET